MYYFILAIFITLFSGCATVEKPTPDYMAMCKDLCGGYVQSVNFLYGDCVCQHEPGIYIDVWESDCPKESEEE